MSKESRLVKNTFILLVGVIGTRIISFIMLPFYTEWLSIDEYGKIDIFTTVVSMCVPILTLQLEQAVFRFVLDDKTDEEKKVTVTSGVLCVLLVLAFIITFVGFYFVISKKYIYILYLLAICLQCLYIMCQQVVRGNGQNYIYTQNSILLAIVNLILTILFIKFLNLSSIGYVLSFCMAHIFSIFYMMLKSKLHKLICIASFRVEKLKKLLLYSLPMIINNVSWWVLNASDRIVINCFLGITANGLYAAAGKIPGLVTTLYSVFQMAWQESASREQGENLDKFYSDIFRKMFALMSYFVVVMLLCGKLLFKLLISEKFEVAYAHLPILLIALLFLCVSQFYGGIYVGMKKSNELGWTSAVAALINLAINLSSVKLIGLFAASISTLIAYMALSVLRYLGAKKICNIHYYWKNLIVAGSILLISFILAYIPGILYQLGALIAFSVAYGVVYRDDLLELYGAIKRKIGR